MEDRSCGAPKRQSSNGSFVSSWSQVPRLAIPYFYVSTTLPFDSTEAFLQVIGWDPKAGAYQFYDRRDGAWIWAGSSWEALDPLCRGKGPFDSHVNGSLNMKELKIPWLHWHSMSAGIRDEVLAPNDRFALIPCGSRARALTCWSRTSFRPGIVRWQNARFAACVTENRLTRLPEFMRQVLETLAVNIASTAVVSCTIREARA